MSKHKVRKLDVLVDGEENLVDLVVTCKYGAGRPNTFDYSDSIWLKGVVSLGMSYVSSEKGISNIVKLVDWDKCRLSIKEIIPLEAGFQEIHLQRKDLIGEPCVGIDLTEKFLGLGVLKRRIEDDERR